VDKARTGDLTPDGMGVAVSVLHTGGSYADDLSADSLLSTTHQPIGVAIAMRLK